MKDKYQIGSKIILVFAVILFVSSIGSIIYTAIDSGNIYFDPTSKGLNDFVKYYPHQLSMLGISILLFTVWVTFERMRQTSNLIKNAKTQVEISMQQINALETQIERSQEQIEVSRRQIEIMRDDSMFNNYFKHRDRFLEHCIQNELINKILAKSRTKSNATFLTYYGYYFCKSYKEFIDYINPEIKLQVNEFLEAVENSALNRQNDLQSIDLNEILNVVTKFKYHESDARLIILLSSMHEKDFQIKYEDLKAKSESDRFLILFIIFLTVSIINIVKSFVGEDIKGAPEFMVNYFTYLEKLGMETWLLGDYKVNGKRRRNN